MNGFFETLGNWLAIRIGEKKYRPRLSVMGIVILVTAFVSLVYMIFCTVAHGPMDFASDGYEHSLLLGFGWAFVAMMFLLDLDLAYRHEASHILMSSLTALTVTLYFLLQGIRLLASTATVAAGVFSLASVFFLVWSLLFYVKKAFDGDASWLMKTIIGLGIACIVFAWATSYNVLDAYAHFNDSIFWDGVLMGIIGLLAFVYASYVSIVSDYDPHPIVVDELGNIVEEGHDDKGAPSTTNA